MPMKLRLTKKYFLLVLLCCSAIAATFAQTVTVTVNTALNKKAVSPYIYGKNESFNKSASFYKDAGLRFARSNGGNNATKYNWRRKLWSSPDWYNNVYAEDWDAVAQKFAAQLPGVQVMFAFQLIGKAAKSTNHNFPDWCYDGAKGTGAGNNYAGGGGPSFSNTTWCNPYSYTGNGGNGDINLYLEDWNADSTTGILDHWFGANGLGLNKNQFLYWNMDNEVDIWNGTHDDVMPTQIAAFAFIDTFIVVAKKARALFPEIKICGPVTTSEWQWYKWANESIWINGKYYCWLEYFIKRCADEEKKSGIRVIDVVDLHNYPYAPTDQDALQLHRMYYDKNYIYPGANGLKTINGGWDNTQTKEYIFQRINDWLTTYFGSNRGITTSISEWGPSTSGNANVTSLVYGSALGTFANNGVELFSPWIWSTGMWETLHLFSRYGKNYSVSSTSSLENTVSAYTTVNQAADSMTVIIVNRDMSASHTVTVNLNGFSADNGSASTLQLASLPSTETFISHSSNALKSNSVTVNSNSFSIAVPALSTTAVLLKSTTTTTTGILKNFNQADELKLFPNPAADNLTVSIGSIAIDESTEIIVFDQMGRKIQVSEINYGAPSSFTLDVSAFSRGLYFLSVKNSHYMSTKPFSIIR
jgi:hypothetical protein